MCVIDCRNRQSLNALASAVENIRKNNRIGEGKELPAAPRGTPPATGPVPQCAGAPYPSGPFAMARGYRTAILPPPGGRERAGGLPNGRGWDGPGFEGERMKGAANKCVFLSAFLSPTKFAGTFFRFKSSSKKTQ